MNTRIKDIRKSQGLSQQKFADVLGIARGNIAAYEVGKNLPSDAVISLICTKFNINKEWLLNGNGDMYNLIDLDDYSEISTLIGEQDPMAKQAIIDYWNLSSEDKELFWKFINKFIRGEN